MPVATSQNHPEVRQWRATSPNAQEERGRPIHQAQAQAKIAKILLHTIGSVPALDRNYDVNVDISITRCMLTALRCFLQSLLPSFSYPSIFMFIR